MSKFCSACGTALPEGAVNCAQCGKPVESQGATSPQPPPAQPPAPPVHAPNKNPGGFESFLNFDTMITPLIMKIIYIIGTVGIVLAMLFFMFAGGGFLGFIAGLIGGALALVYFRVMCEMLILFFKMHSDIRQIKNNSMQK